uniref:hypothetical protein n=1 Tax=Succinivibrio sp. TaxID=2053619 RepID=UPI00402AE5C0
MLKRFFINITSVLYKEYENYPNLIIDEYDVPLERVSYHDSINSVLYKDKKDQELLALGISVEEPETKDNED